MDNQNKKQQKTTPPKINNSYILYGFILMLIIGLFLFGNDRKSNVVDVNVFYKYYQDSLIEKIAIVNDKYVEIYIKPDKLKTDPRFKDVALNRWRSTNPGPHFTFNIPNTQNFLENLDKEQINIPNDKKLLVETKTKEQWLPFLLTWALPLGLIIFFWLFVMKRMSGGGGAGGGLFSIGKSKATLFDKENAVSVTFKDVAGLDEAKEEVMEVVDFLKYPKKYTSLGGKIPKGVLLVGPPGTGKTLLAKAVAGEAKVPFFTLSGSDFVEMFVGVGASRVRDLFRQAKEKAPCIIFIDEIDAIGRSRGKNIMSSNDERESTLNQLLVEMDGFGTDSGVILMAATNRPDVLDSALLRPGRFDRQISIDRPDIVGREQIFNVHVQKLTRKLEGENAINTRQLAAQTPGFAGAEIANVCNEAALIAARNNKTAVDMLDFNDAIDRVIGGLEKKNKLISPDEKKIIAYHEAGHALLGWFLEHTHPLVKVTIVPRGTAALGFAQYLPNENYIENTEQMYDVICMSLGGRAAEQIIFSKISTGALSDLDQVTRMAYAMVTVYGMNDKVGNVSFYRMNDEYGMTKPYSDVTAQLIDDEVRNIIEMQYRRAIRTLTDHQDSLELIAHELLSKELLYTHDIERLIGPSPFPNKYQHYKDNGIHLQGNVSSKRESTNENNTDANLMIPNTNKSSNE